MNSIFKRFIQLATLFSLVLLVSCAHCKKGGGSCCKKDGEVQTCQKDCCKHDCKDGCKEDCKSECKDKCKDKENCKEAASGEQCPIKKDESKPADQAAAPAEEVKKVEKKKKGKK